MIRARTPGTAGLALAAVLAVGVSAAADVLVTVGDVSDTTAMFWARGVAAGPVTLTVAGGPDGAVTRRSLPATEAADLTVRSRLTGLTPATRYRYRVDSAGASTTGEFSTAPDPARPAPVTLVWSGDLGARGHCRRPSGWPVFRAMAERHPDLFLFVGDTIYADHRCSAEGGVPGADFVATTLDEFRAKHRYNRADPNLQALLRATPVTAVWDDHEVRNNFAGPAARLAPVGLGAFLDYWPLSPPAAEPTRLYRSLRWGRLLEVFVLDTRQYRSPNWRPDGPAKTMLGAAQRDWLLERLSASDAVWKVVVTSVPLSVPKGWPFGDSWARRRLLFYRTGFATERDALLRALAGRGVRNLVFLSADVHFSAVIAHEVAGLRFHELLAGPLAAGLKAPRPPETGLGARVLFARGDVENFGELAIAEDGAAVRIVDAEGRLLVASEISPRGSRAAPGRRAGPWPGSAGRSPGPACPAGGRSARSRGGCWERRSPDDRRAPPRCGPARR